MKYILPILLFALVFGGCNTAPPKLIYNDPIVHEVADLRMEFIYLDEGILEHRHGHNDARSYVNPYYSYPALITKKRLLVFEFNASTVDSELEFRLNNIYLSIGNVSGDAKSRPYLHRLWSHFDVAEMTKIDRTLKETILDREFSVNPDKSVSGYLVFGENYPKEGGEGMIMMDIVSTSGDEGRIEVPLNFSADGMKKPGNTGIFKKD